MGSKPILSLIFMVLIAVSIGLLPSYFVSGVRGTILTASLFFVFMLLIWSNVKGRI